MKQVLISAAERTAPAQATSRAGDQFARPDIAPQVRERNLRALARMASAVAVAYGTLVLAGWVLRIPALQTLLPGQGAMHPLSALLFVLSGISLWKQARVTPAFASSSANGRVATITAALVGLVGLGFFVAHLTGHALVVDRLAQLGMPTHGVVFKPNVAKNFLLLSLALLLGNVTLRKGVRPNEIFGVWLLLIAFLAILGFIYGIGVLRDGVAFMPVSTALLFFLLALGVLCTKPDRGLAGLIISNGPGGSTARTLLPAMALVLLVLGWLRIEGERRGLFSVELGIALYTFAFMTIFGTMIWWSARSLYRVNLVRMRLENERDRFFALSSDLHYIAGSDGFLRSVNVTWQSLLGFSQDELLGMPFIDLIHPDDRAATLAKLETAEHGAKIVSYENRIRRRDGSYRCFSWSATTEPDSGLIYGSARDITDRKEAEDNILALNTRLAENASKLEQSNRELEAFSYTISHDLRAPLRHIDGYAGMLREDAADTLEPEMRRYLDVISDSARHMGSLIDDLLAFSRLGRQSLQRADVDMDELVQRALKEASGSTPFAGVVSVAALPRLEADPVLWRQVWVNLLSNALKYSAPRGPDARIQVSGEQAGNVVRYRIRDNGVGFDMRFADKLFGVFQRLHSHDEFEGTGVGLAIVQRVIARHGGRIVADAELDRGATFTIEIPATEVLP
jgi:PAS domain S-box-containing protein